MARDLTPIVKQSRRENFALHPKAHKYLIKKASMPVRYGRRGGGGGNNQYKIQLREKQKVRRLYGLLEKQFSNLFKKAIRQAGQTGDNALIMLESRFDNAVYRAGFAISRRSARQLVSHKHFTLNGRRVNIASITLQEGDLIAVHQSSAKNSYFKNLNDRSPTPSQVPNWLDVDRKTISFKIASPPAREDVIEEINEQLLVEYYSR